MALPKVCVTEVTELTDHPYPLSFLRYWKHPRPWADFHDLGRTSTVSVRAMLSWLSLDVGMAGWDAWWPRHFHASSQLLFCKKKIKIKKCIRTRGGYRGGGGGGRSLPSGIPPPADPKGPPFDTFSEIHFWPTDPKIFVKAPLVPIYTNFEGEPAPKKTRFFCQNFSKSAQKRLFWLFFQKFACGAENLAKIGAKQCFGRTRKINLVDLKKRLSKFWNIFWKSAPPPSRKS